MTKIQCYNLKCKYCDDYNCKKKNVVLGFYQVNTLYQGNQDYLKCASLKMSKIYEKIGKVVEEALKEVKK